MTSLDPPTVLTGWDLRAGAHSRPDAAEVFAQSAPHDSVANARYELIAVAARGFRPPQFLSAVEWRENGAATQADQDPDVNASYEGLRPVWSVLYRRVAETAPAVVTPYAIYLLGVNPPAEATDRDLEVFNDFYTNVHMREVAERRHALRAVRFELVRAIKPPYHGAPRFLAIYEVDEKAAAIRRHVGPPYATGPDVWQRHTTPWRLWYRRLVAKKT